VASIEESCDRKALVPTPGQVARFFKTDGRTAWLAEREMRRKVRGGSDLATRYVAENTVTSTLGADGKY
jgi:hypothetical protein